MVAAPLASAGTIHTFSSTFGSQGSGAGQMSSPQDVAVNDTSGDVYVADTGNDRVDVFDSSGNFVAAWGDDVDATTGGNVCTAVSGDACQAGTSSSTPGGFEAPEFIAVDNSTGASAGDVYVGDTGDDLVSKFAPDGSLVTSWGDGGGASCGSANGQLSGACASGGPFTAIAGITIDSAGDLYVYDSSTENWFEFAQDGTAQPTISVDRGTDNVGIGVDSDGNFYKVVGAGYLEQFDNAGDDLGEVSDDMTGSEITGFAIDPTSNDIYADDGGGVIRHYLGSSLSTCVPAGDCAAADTFGSANLSGSAAGVAYNQASGAVYVADAGGNDVAGFTAEVVPDVATGQATAIQPASATLNGTVNPDGTTLTDCHFAYVDAAGYDPSASNPYAGGGTAACSSTPSGSSPEAVSAQIAGLAAGTTYDVQLYASNSNGTTPGGNVTFQTPPPPSIDSATVSNQTASSVDLNAQINPNGLDTTYQFQWGTGTSYRNDVPVPAADIGSGTSDVSVTQQLTGLSANTEYHWRVVATNADGTATSVDHTFSYPITSSGTDTCPNAELRTENNSESLPDCRAYEMVTPPDKQGAIVQPTAVGSSDQSIDAGGNGIVGQSLTAFAGLTGAEGGNVPGTFYYQFTRTASGWTTTPLNPPRSWLASLGADDSVWEPAPGYLNVDQLSLRSAAGTVSEIGPMWPTSDSVPEQVTSMFVQVDGAAADASDAVVYELDDTSLLWPFDSSLSTPSLYEYKGTGNSQPTLVGVSGGVGSTTLVSQCGTALGGNDFGGAAYNAVSQDGSTVYFTAQGADNNDCGGTEPPVNELLARIGEAQTVPISEPSAAACGSCDESSPQDAIFQGASADGSKVFFTTTQTLLGSDTSNNLYLYDFDPPSGQPAVVRVSAGDGTGSGPADVQNVLGVSEDGSHVYFTAQGVLTTAADAEGGQAEQGANNLYVYERDAAHPTGQVAFIGDLCSGADTSGTVNDSQCPAGDNSNAAQVTPDGQFLVFVSHAELTSDDTGSAAQVFRYDASSGQLTRVSAGEDGFNDDGNAIAGADASVGRVRTMSDDGSRVFFQSPVALVPGALNLEQAGDAGYAPNVYEWEQAGAGSCPAGQASGCVYLISDGRDTTVTAPNDRIAPSVQLIGTDATGSNVFFTTADELVPEDQDTLVDFYDARVDGGFAPPTGPSQCEGDSCQGSPGGAPTPPSVGTVNFTGPGDSTSKPASGRVKVTRKAVEANVFRLNVKVPAKGKITITGADVKRVFRSASKAGAYKVTVHLTARARQQLKKKHRLRVAVKVAYKPAAGRSSWATVSLELKA